MFVGVPTKDTLIEVWPSHRGEYHGQVVDSLVELLGVTLGFGLPWVAALIVVAAGLDRLLRLGERHGLAFVRRSWTTVGVGNALLQLHVALEPQRARIETQLAIEDPEPGDRIGDWGNGPCKRRLRDNVIDIDFVQRRRRS
jgi:hypothetical protein